MIEKLIELRFPPGFRNNGTTLQAMGRWFQGNLVRFFQDTIQPVGGWVARSTTGATITGVPNAAVAWETNDGLSFIAIGTSTGLFVVDVNNVVYDIMATGLVGVPSPIRWQLAVFGSWLVANYNLTAYDPNNSLNTLVWEGDTTQKAIQAGHATSPAQLIPGTIFGVVTTPERFLVLLRGADVSGAAHRAPTGGAIFDPSTGLVLDSSLNGQPAPVGAPIIGGGNDTGGDTSGAALKIIT